MKSTQKIDSRLGIGNNESIISEMLLSLTSPVTNFVEIIDLIFLI